MSYMHKVQSLPIRVFKGLVKNGIRRIGTGREEVSKHQMPDKFDSIINIVTNIKKKHCFLT